MLTPNKEQTCKGWYIFEEGMVVHMPLSAVWNVECLAGCERRDPQFGPSALGGFCTKREAVAALEAHIEAEH